MPFRDRLRNTSAWSCRFSLILLCLILMLAILALSACGKADDESSQLKLQEIERTESTTALETETVAETSAPSESETIAETTSVQRDYIVSSPDHEVERAASLSDYAKRDEEIDWALFKNELQADDEVYAAELAAAELAAAELAAAEAAAAQAAAYAAQLAAQPAVQQPVQAYQPPVAPAAGEGGGVMHDTYAGAMTIIQMLNNHRASIGIAPLVNDAVMQEIALVRAPEVGNSYRASGDVTGHNHGGIFALTWIAQVYGANSGLAENTGFFRTGSKTPEEIFYAFLNSPPHYATMVNPNLTRVGIALYYDPIDNREYVVMNFGN